MAQEALATTDPEVHGTMAQEALATAALAALPIAAPGALVTTAQEAPAIPVPVETAAGVPLVVNSDKRHQGRAALVYGNAVSCS